MSGAEPAFVDVAESAVVVEERLTRVVVDGVAVALTRLEGALVAFADRCPHASGSLSEGEYGRGRVICPVHGWKFDIRSGAALWPRDELLRLRHVPVREGDGRVLVARLI